MPAALLPGKARNLINLFYVVNADRQAPPEAIDPIPQMDLLRLTVMPGRIQMAFVDGTVHDCMIDPQDQVTPERYQQRVRLLSEELVELMPSLFDIAGQIHQAMSRSGVVLDAQGMNIKAQPLQASFGESDTFQ